MPILIEGISVVVPRWTIERHYPGRWKSYVADCPNASLIFDDCLAAVAFMDRADAEAFIARLANRGLQPMQDGEAQHVVRVDQRQGLLHPCPWIELMVVEGGRGERLLCARLKGNPGFRVVFPKGWRYETSLTKCGIRIPRNELDDRARLLGRAEGIDIYEDLRSGGLAWAERVMVTGGGEKSLKLELENVCYEVDVLAGLMRSANPADKQRVADRIVLRIGKHLLPRVAAIIKGEGSGMPLAYHTFGRIMRSLHKPEHALEAFKAANTLGPGNIETLIEIVVCHLKLKNHEKALEAAREATDIAPLRAEAWELRTIAADFSGHQDEARAAIKEALLLKPNDEDYLEMLSQLREEPPAND